MERLTEYHSGVAVIRDKSKLSEAMAKLARYEDLEEHGALKKQTNADRIRNMTDEELAELLNEKMQQVSCCGDCKGMYLEWLKKEVGCE